MAHRCPYCDAEINAKTRRWNEVCECFRLNRGEVSTLEADKYLQRREGFFHNCVLEGRLKGKMELNRNGNPRFYVNVRDAVNCIRIPYEAC